MGRHIDEFGLQLDSSAGSLDAVLWMPEKPIAQCVLAHGARAGMQHANMHAIAAAVAEAGVASLRFNFPYMQQGRRRVDGRALAVESIVAAAGELKRRNALPLLLAGHSFGGRMCSHAVLDAELACAGLIFCSFPLHQPKRPGKDRAAHMKEIQQPALFLSGTRDELARTDLLEEVAADMVRARIHWLETANHSYVILKRTRNNPLSVFEEMSQAVSEFVSTVL